MNSRPIPRALRQSADLQGKYLTFSLNAEEYAVNILQVTEIIGFMKIRAVPGASHDVKGVINLRGRIIPVIDLRIRFGINEIEPSAKTCIVIVELLFDSERYQVGMIVDTVNEVMEFSAEQIELMQDRGVSLNAKQMEGMAKRPNGDVIMLLDISQVLNLDQRILGMSGQSDTDTVWTGA